MKIKLFKYKWLFLFFTFWAVNTVNAASVGEDLYLGNCRSCHAVDGSGTMPFVPDLIENQAWMTMDENGLIHELMLGVRQSGVRMRMPAKGGNPDLTEDNMKQIIHYMKATFKK